MIDLVAILGLGILCGGWILAQRFIARRDPGAPGVEGCGSCAAHRPGTPTEHPASPP